MTRTHTKPVRGIWEKPNVRKFSSATDQPTESNFRAFQGAHGPGHMGLVAATWVPMGALSKNQMMTRTHPKKLATSSEKVNFSPLHNLSTASALKAATGQAKTSQSDGPKSVGAPQKFMWGGGGVGGPRSPIFHPPPPREGALRAGSLFSIFFMNISNFHNPPPPPSKFQGIGAQPQMQSSVSTAQKSRSPTAVRWARIMIW